jgi:hypothetical protein
MARPRVGDAGDANHEQAHAAPRFERDAGSGDSGVSASVRSRTTTERLTTAARRDELARARDLTAASRDRAAQARATRLQTPATSAAPATAGLRTTR